MSLSDKQLDEMVSRCADWAEEAAKKDIAFCGDQFFDRHRISPEAREQIREALELYARRGAIGTVRALHMRDCLAKGL